MIRAMVSTAIVFIISCIFLNAYLKSSIIATICVNIETGKLMFIGSENDAAEYHKRIASFESIPNLEKNNLDCQIKTMTRQIY